MGSGIDEANGSRDTWDWGVWLDDESMHGGARWFMNDRGSPRTFTEDYARAMADKEWAERRGQAVRALLKSAGVVPYVLRLSKYGCPEHPLYIPYEIVPQGWPYALGGG